MAQKKSIAKVDPNVTAAQTKPIIDKLDKMRTEKEQAAATIGNKSEPAPATTQTAATTEPTPANAPTKPEKADSKALFDNFNSKNMFGDYYKWRVIFSEDGTKDRRIALQLYPQIAAEVERISKELNVSMSDLITGAIVKLIQDYNSKK